MAASGINTSTFLEKIVFCTYLTCNSEANS